MLTVHHLGLSQSERIVWLCEELGLDYELKRYDRRSDNRMAPDEYKALHPMGSAPVITDGDLTLGESGAIATYIDAKYGHGKLSPDPDDADFADHLYWFHFANGSLMPLRFMQLTAKLLGADAPPAMVQDRSQKAWAMIEDYLGRRPFFGGRNLSKADCMMIWSLTTSRKFSGEDISPYPNVLAYLQRIGGRDAYVRAMAKAEPGMEPVLT